MQYGTVHMIKWVAYSVQRLQWPTEVQPGLAWRNFAAAATDEVDLLLKEDVLLAANAPTAAPAATEPQQAAVTSRTCCMQAICLMMRPQVTLGPPP